MANGVSTSALGLALKRKSISDVLSGQTEKLQDTPDWKTISSILLPLIATVAMPGIGGLLATAGGALGGVGAAGGVLSGISGAAGGALSTLGTGLQFGIKAAKGASSLGKALHFLTGAAAKSGFGILSQKAIKAAQKKYDKRSEMDISLAGMDPVSQLLGREAVGKLRGDYTKAERQADTTNLTASIMAGIMQQAGGDLAKAIKGIYSKGTAVASGMTEGAKQSLMQRLMPIKSNVFQPVGQRTALGKLTGGLLPSSLPGVAPRVSQNVLSELMKTVPIEKTIFDQLGKASTVAEPVIGMGAERYGKSIMDELLSLSQYDFGGYSPGKYGRLIKATR
jgi:hypothetical protein